MGFDSASRHMVEHSVTGPWTCQEVFWYLHRHLPILRPLPDRIEVLAHMLRVEVHERLWHFLIWRLPPHLAQYANVHSAHELLSDDVKTVRWKLC